MQSDRVTVPYSLVSLVLFQTLVIVSGIIVSSADPCMAGELSADNLFDPNQIRSISITLPDEDWKILRKQTRDPRKAFSGIADEPFTWFKGEIVVDGNRLPSVSIRKKGFIGSLDDRWPSLKVKVDKNERSTIDGVDVFTLNNNKQDTSLLSQVLAYQLFNAAGVNAPRCSFVRVAVNGEDLGLYLNVESIGKPYLKRRFGNGSGNLYEGALADFYPRAISRLEVKSNKGTNDNAKILKLATMLAGKEPLNLDQVEQIVDLDNFLRFWAVESLIGFWDGYTNNQNNFWVYDNPQNAKLYFMPWGADGAFTASIGFPGFGPSRPVSLYSESQLANRLFHQDGIPDRYRNTMKWVLANVWKETDLLKTVDAVETLVSTDLHQRQKDSVREMKKVRDFIRTRRAKVEKELDKWPVQVADEPRKPMYTVPTGSANGSFKTTWLENAPKDISRSGTLSIEAQLDDETIEFEHQGVSLHKKAQRSFPMGFGPPPESQSKEEIVLSGVRTSDKKKIVITLPVDVGELKKSIGETIDVQGTVSGMDDGKQGFNPFGGRVVQGTLKMTSAEMNPGEVVEGEFRLTISAIHGGFMGRNPPKPPSDDRGAAAPEALRTP